MTQCDVKIGAVIVTFNRLAALKQTLAQVCAQSFDVIYVVDNASSDGTAEWLASWQGAQGDPRVVVLRLADNLGGAGGFHAGLQAAEVQPNPPDWIALFDDDAMPETGAIDAFRGLAPMLDADIGAVSAAVTYPDGKICEMNRQGRNPFWHPRVFLSAVLGGGREGHHVTDADLAREAAPCDVDNASFVGFILRRAAITETVGTLAQKHAAGLPEAGLFIYGDDVLYSLRLRRAGWRIRLLPSVRFVHDCGTMGEGFVYRPLWKIYYHCRNGVAIARVAAGPIVFPAALAYYILQWVRRGFSCPAAERKTYFKLMRMGLRDGVLWRRGRCDAAHRIAQQGR
jgi:GT2 family glycosyltransferase